MSDTGREKEREQLPAHPFLGAVRDTVSHKLFGKDSEEDAKGSSLFKAVGKIAKHAVFGSDESSNTDESKESKADQAKDETKQSDQSSDSSRGNNDKYNLKLQQHLPHEREAIAQESHRDESSEFTSLHDKFKPSESSDKTTNDNELQTEEISNSIKKEETQEKPADEKQDQEIQPLPSEKLEMNQQQQSETKKEFKSSQDKQIEEKVEQMENCIYEIASDMDKMGMWPHSNQPLHLPPCGAEVSEEYSSNPSEIRRGDECGILPQDVEVKVDLSAPFIHANAYGNSDTKSSTHAGETLEQFPNLESDEATTHRKEISERYQHAAEHNQRSQENNFSSQWPEKSQEISQPKEEEYSLKSEPQQQQQQKSRKSVRISEEASTLATNNNNNNIDINNNNNRTEGYLFELRTADKDNNNNYSDDNDDYNYRKMQRANDLRKYYEDSLKKDEEDSKRALEEFNRKVEENNSQQKAATTIERAYRHHRDYQQRHRNDNTMRIMTDKEQREEAKSAKEVQSGAEGEKEEYVSDCFMDYLENAAATTIQRVFRGYYERRHLRDDKKQNVKIHKEIQEEDERQNRLAQDIEREIEAAIKIQAGIRGHLARMKQSGGQPHEGARDWNSNSNNDQQEFTEIDIEEVSQEKSNDNEDLFLNKEEEAIMSENSPLIPEISEAFISEYGTVQEISYWNNENDNIENNYNINNDIKEIEEYLNEEEEPCIMVPFKEEEKNSNYSEQEQQQQNHNNVGVGRPKKQPAVVAGGRRVHQAEHPYYLPKSAKKHDNAQQQDSMKNDKETDQNPAGDKQMMKKDDYQMKKSEGRLRRSASRDEDSKIFPSTYHSHDKADNSHKRTHVPSNIAGNAYTKSH